MRARHAIIGIVAILLEAASAEAGVIHGTLWMGEPQPAPRARSARERKAVRESLREAQRGVMDAVIYVERVPVATEARLANPPLSPWMFRRRRPCSPRMKQTKLEFEPRVVAVAAGSHVEFQNLDHVYHSAFSVSAGNAFKLGALSPGRIDSVRFERTGLVRLYCDIHSKEFGYVVVTPNHVMVRPDPFGAYRLPKLPPGTYTVRVWHPARTELRHTVEVPRRGNVSLDLELAVTARDEESQARR